MRVLVIGYGNPLREDDGIGWAAAQSLVRMAHDMPHMALTVETVHQLLPELADLISQTDLVIFVDAAVTGNPGDIRCEEIRPLPQSPGAFSHHVGPAGLLEMAQALYGRFPLAYLFTVTAASLGYGETLSTVVAAVLPELLNQMMVLIQNTAANGRFHLS